MLCRTNRRYWPGARQPLYIIGASPLRQAGVEQASTLSDHGNQRKPPKIALRREVKIPKITEGEELGCGAGRVGAKADNRG